MTSGRFDEGRGGTPLSGYEHRCHLRPKIPFKLFQLITFWQSVSLCVRERSQALLCSGLCSTVSDYISKRAVVRLSHQRPSWPCLVCDVTDQSESIRLFVFVIIDVLTMWELAPCEKIKPRPCMCRHLIPAAHISIDLILLFHIGCSNNKRFNGS